MRFVILDLDTLRPDHLGCYGYHRDTSPVIDSIAADGVRFDNYHCPDAPCLPSRAALITGRFGIHNGAVGHGDTTADVRLYGEGRGMQDNGLAHSLFMVFRHAGYYTASISPFPERHSSYWFTAGLNEQVNTGRMGFESAEEIMPSVMDWLDRRGTGDNWCLHINMWDPHTPYRAPAEFGNPFENEPISAWLTQEVFQEHLKHVGPHSVNEISMYSDQSNPNLPRQLGKATNMDELRQVMDGYDCGIRYMDGKIGEIINLLKEKGIYEDTAILVTADHGENMGELGIYAEHATADEITTRIPMIIKMPGMRQGAVDTGLHYNLDLSPTLAEYFGVPAYEKWDGKSYLPALKDGGDCGWPYLVVSQNAHVCQRSVRFDDYIYIRTYHCGYHLFDKEMLFNVKEDFYEQHNLAEERPDLCDRACRLLTDWTQDQILSADVPVDPMWTTLHEGGPFHAKGYLKLYCERLEATGRAEGAAKLREKYPDEFKPGVAKTQLFGAPRR